MRVPLALLLLAAAGLGVYALTSVPWEGTSDSSEDAADVAPVEGPRLGPYPASQFLIEPDRFLAATDPQVMGADEVDFLLPEDEIFGVVVDGAPRAYPVTMLSYHHVVNDVVRGIPVAVTY